MVGAVVGGAASRIGGGKFENGAITGAMSAVIADMVEKSGQALRNHSRGGGLSEGVPDDSKLADRRIIRKKGSNVINLSANREIDAQYYESLTRDPTDPSVLVVAMHGNERGQVELLRPGNWVDPEYAAKFIRPFIADDIKVLKLAICYSGYSGVGQEFHEIFKLEVMAPNGVFNPFTGTVYSTTEGAFNPDKFKPDRGWEVFK